MNDDIIAALHEQMRKDKEREQNKQYAAWCEHFATLPPDFVPKLKAGLKPEIELAPMRWMRLGLDLIQSAHGTSSIQLFDGKAGPHLQTYLPYPVFQAGTEIFLKGMWLAQHPECRAIESNDYASPELRKKYQGHLKKLGHDLLGIVAALEQVPLYREEGNIARFLKIISGVTREYYYPLTKEDARGVMHAIHADFTTTCRRSGTPTNTKAIPNNGRWFSCSKISFAESISCGELLRNWQSGHGRVNSRKRSG